MAELLNKVSSRRSVRFSVHAKLKRKLQTRPSAKPAGVTISTTDEAAGEHATFKQLVEEPQGMNASDAQYDAKVKVLPEYVNIASSKKR
jgi:hypothetical protein